MKKAIARIMILLMVLNIGVFKGSYAIPEFPDPVLVDSSATGAVFKYHSGTSGILYYTVTYMEETAPTADQVKADALSGALSATLIAKGHVEVNVVQGSEGIITITGLSGKNYKLHTTFKINGDLNPVTTREFTALGFELVPTVVMTDTNKIIVKSKLNNSGVLYVGVYKDGTGITAMDVVSALDADPPTIDPNRAYGFKETVTNGIETTSIISFIDKYQAYDLIFVKKDNFGNVSQTVQTLVDKKATETQLMNATYAFLGGDLLQSAVYLYFKDDIEEVGDKANYTISFKKDGEPDSYIVAPENFVINTSGSAANVVELNLNSAVYMYFYEMWGYSGSGTMEVTVNNSGGFAPLVASGHQTSTFVMPVGSYCSTTGAVMKSASYENTGLGEITGDRIVVATTWPMYLIENPSYTTPAAVNFDVSVVGLDQPLALVPGDDFELELVNASHFNIVFTSGAATKFALLPTSVIKITGNNVSADPYGNWFRPYAKDIYVPRLSSNSTLSSIELYGRPIALTASKQYTVPVPYLVLQAYNSTPAAALRVVPSDPQSYTTISTVGPNESRVMVIPANGEETSYSNYIILTPANDLTLAGISVNGIKMTSFDPYATSYAYTITESITPIPVVTVAHSENVTASVTSVLSPTLANTYVYTVTLTSIGSQTYQTFTVTVTGAAATEPPVTPPIDQPVTPPVVNPTTPPRDSETVDKGGSGAGTGGSGGGAAGAGTTASNVDPTTEINSLIGLSMENLTGQNITNNMKTVETAMDSISNDAQAFDTLTKVDDFVKKLNASMTNNPTVNRELSTMVTQMTTKMEQKLNMIESPQNRLKVLGQFLVEAKLFKINVGEPMATMDKSVEDMVQKTANAFGTLKLEAPPAGQATTVDDQMLANVIEKQTTALIELSKIQQNYFETSATRIIKKEITIESGSAANSAMFKVDLAANQVGTLKTANIDAVTISNTSAEIKLPVLNLKPTESAQIAIEKMPPVTAGSVSGGLVPNLSYAVEFSINNVPQLRFGKPITLGFNLETFGLQNESTLDLSIFKLNIQTNVWDPVGGIVDPETSKIFVTRDNLSQYTVLKSKKSFSDADQSWAKAEINALLNKGIVSDTAKFEPQSALTRGEFAQWISKAYGLKVSDQSLPFKDVAKTGASYEAIAAVYQQGILSGKSKTNFDPSGKVTQNEMAAALGKLMVSFNNKEKSGKVTSKYLSQLKTTQVASWAEDDMALLMELGLNISGKSGGEAVTKEAAASAFMKFYRS